MGRGSGEAKSVSDVSFLKCHVVVVWPYFGVSGWQRLKKAFTVVKPAQIRLKIASKTMS